MRRNLFDRDHQDFRSSVAAFVDSRILPNRDLHASEGAIPREIWKEAGNLGFLGLCVPEQYGGGGVGDYRYNAVLDEELTRAGLAYACAIGVHTHVIAPYLVSLTTEEQRNRWLPAFCSGDLVTAIAMTEPSGGSDLAAIRSRAIRKEGVWVLNGSKTFITNGSTADLVIVAAQTEPGSRGRGLGLFAVEAGTPGFDRGKRLDKVGQPQGDTAELYFEDVLIPDSNVIGPIGQAFDAMLRHLAQERLASAVCNIAHAELVLSETIDHVLRREAFGAPLAQLQSIRFTLADLATDVVVCRSFVDACIHAHVSADLTPVEAAMAKLRSSEVQSVVADTAVQFFGGLGYMRESPIAQHWMDARVTRIWAGTNEIMREIIGRSIAPS